MRKVEAISTAALVATVSLAGALVAAAPVRADGCAGNPDAIGTSRVIAIKYGDYTKLGRLQYPQTLPLVDHEVALTFDDGPMRLLSDKALDILNSQCVKVTYFLIGEMAHYFPDIVRREYASGDAIGTHSEHHPLPFNRLSDEQVQQEIDGGIASVGAALGDPKELAPFFRIPGFGRNATVEQELAKRKLIVFSTDIVADDWFRHITPEQIVQRAMSRLEKRGRGILLLHDIHPATVLALADLLQQLKTNGFHIVQVVPAGPGRPETPVAPAEAAALPEAMLATTMPDALGIDHEPSAPAWPASSVRTTGDDIVLAAPAAKDLRRQIRRRRRPRRRRGKCVVAQTSRSGAVLLRLAIAGTEPARHRRQHARTNAGWRGNRDTAESGSAARNRAAAENRTRSDAPRPASLATPGAPCETRPSAL